MPAPTAPLRAPEILGDDIAEGVPLPPDNDGDFDFNTEPTTIPAITNDVPPTAETVEDTEMQIDTEGRPHFAPDNTTSTPSTKSQKHSAAKVQTRKIPIPPHRMTPLKTSWPKIYPPLVEHLKLQVRMNIHARAVELRTSPAHTTDPSSLQKGEDFIRAFTLGFDVDDAIALLRLDDLYIETFEIKDVKTLQGEHLGRAIGRIAGKDGKTKFAIENTSKTRVVLADSKIHILGGFSNIKIAREAVVSLILGAPPGKVYGNLRTVAGRMKERF